MIPQKEALFWEFQATLNKARAWWQAHGGDILAVGMLRSAQFTCMRLYPQLVRCVWGQEE